MISGLRHLYFELLHARRADPRGHEKSDRERSWPFEPAAP